MNDVEQKAKSIFLAAIESHGPDGWPAYLDEACAGDPGLRGRVEILLRAHGGADSLFDHTGAPLLATMDERTLAEQPGTVIGPYRLLEQIGEGAFGVVFMAEQTQPLRRKVALKILKPGMDTRQVVARFEAERQALALMDHPNIARVLDGGQTSSGRPYFVMELVKGKPITRCCDEKRLGLRERLELFGDVCRAVQHAHQKGIIHRDLKPSNVLVAPFDGKPVVKVIDFGVAKATGQCLTDKTLFTGFGTLVGTPEYMSPEQAEVNNQDIDTRSDIYSLGVLLYELLTGSTPLTRQRMKESALLEVLRIIREEEPPRPSTRLSTTEELPSIAGNRGLEPKKLSGLVRGELDWIVMKALDKDRNRRYETANNLAMDVQRYLGDEPLQASPPSAWYRFRKFTRRNRARLSAAAVLGIALLAVLAAAAGSVGWVARERSDRQARLIAQVELILDDGDRLQQEQKWRAASAAVDRAQAVLAGGEADAAVLRRVDEARRDIAFVAELDRIRQELAVSTEGKINYAREMHDYALAFRQYGVDVEALPPAEAVTRLQKKPVLAAPIVAALDYWVNCRRMLNNADPAWKALVAVAHGLEIDPLRDRFRASWGRPITEVQDELRQLARAIDPKAQRPETILALGATLFRARLDDEALRILKHGQQAHPADFWLNLELGYQLDERKKYKEAEVYGAVAVALRPDSATPANNLGNTLWALGRLDEADAWLRKAIELDPKHGTAYNNLGNVRVDQKKLDEAILCFQKAIEMDPKYAVGHVNLGSAFDLKGRTDEAVAECRKAIEINPQFAAAYNMLGHFLNRQNKRNDAIACFRKAIELAPRYVEAYSNLGGVLLEQNQLDDAVASLRKAIEVDANYAPAYQHLGLTLYRQNKLDEAVASCQKAIELDPKLAHAHYNLGTALHDQGKLSEAAACFRKAIELVPNDATFHITLALVLLNQNKLDEAVVSCRKAIELDPKVGHLILGFAYDRQGKRDQAISCFRKAIELNPKVALAHSHLARALHAQGKVDEAIVEGLEAVRWDPKNAAFRWGLIDTLAPLGRLEEVRVAWEQALASNPPEHDAWYGYAELCLYLKKEDAYRANRKAILKQFGNTTDPIIAERTARTCLLLPASGEELQQAVALADRSVTLGKKHKYYPFFMATKGLAEYRLNHFENAVEWCRKAGARGVWTPTHLVLAMAYQRLGQTEQARKSLDRAIKTYDWKHLNNETGGIIHALRREAEALLKSESRGKAPELEKNS